MDMSTIALVDVIEWFGVVTGVTGAILNAKGRKLSFLIWSCSSVALALTGWLAHRPGLLALQSFYVIINIFGYRSWSGNAPTKDSNSAQTAEPVARDAADMSSTAAGL